MAEAATATAPAAQAAPPPAAATPAPAGTTLTSVPTGEWANGFQNQEIKTYVSSKGFKSAEALAESYKNLEAKMSSRVPEDRMLVLPEKMEGDALRPIFEKLGTPKEPKGYELPRDEKSDPKFTEWAEGMFHKIGLTKTQAQGLLSEYNSRLQSELSTQQESRKGSLVAADTKLKTEWGAEYEKNIHIAKQGAKVLGLDAKTLDVMEALQGREMLFKTLRKIGVSVGEAKFIDGNTQAPAQLTPEQAQAEINTLVKDQKFAKKLAKGDAEATQKWSKLHEIATPGTKTIG